MLDEKKETPVVESDKPSDKATNPEVLEEKGLDTTIAEDTTKNFRTDVPPEDNPNLEKTTDTEDSGLSKRKAEELSAQPETKEEPVSKKQNIETTDKDLNVAK